MAESEEGIAGRKWSLGRNTAGDVQLMQGTLVIATLSKEGEALLHLLVTAPQLWAAANDVLRVLRSQSSDVPTIGPVTAAALDDLAAAVAKAVNKTDWEAVIQP